MGLRRLICRLAVTIYEFGKHDEPLGRGANVIGGIAGDESKLRIVGRLDHADIFRHYDSFSGDLISENAAAAADLNLVALVQFIDMPEKGIAMGRDHRVSGLAGLGSLLHVAGTFRKFVP